MHYLKQISISTWFICRKKYTNLSRIYIQNSQMLAPHVIAEFDK
jgi:hypothetical protein